MHWPSLSVITPSYNQAEFLERTIASVLSQDYPALEYLVMDGGSTDGSVAILERHAAAGKLRFVSQRDAGQSDAVNQGFRRTSGDIIGWVNSDDLYAPGALRAVGEYFAAHPEVEWLFGRCPIVDRELAYFRSSGDNKMSLQWRQSFREDLEAAARVARAGEGAWIVVHRLNGWKNSAAYWLFDRLR